MTHRPMMHGKALTTMEPADEYIPLSSRSLSCSLRVVLPHLVPFARRVTAGFRCLCMVRDSVVARTCADLARSRMD